MIRFLLFLPFVMILVIAGLLFWFYHNNMTRIGPNPKGIAVVQKPKAQTTEEEELLKKMSVSLDIKDALRGMRENWEDIHQQQEKIREVVERQRRLSMEQQAKLKDLKERIADLGEDQVASASMKQFIEDMQAKVDSLNETQSEYIKPESPFWSNINNVNEQIQRMPIERISNLDSDDKFQMARDKFNSMQMHMQALQKNKDEFINIADDVHARSEESIEKVRLSLQALKDRLAANALARQSYLDNKVDDMLNAQQEISMNAKDQKEMIAALTQKLDDRIAQGTSRVNDLMEAMKSRLDDARIKSNELRQFIKEHMADVRVKAEEVQMKLDDVQEKSRQQQQRLNDVINDQHIKTEEMNTRFKDAALMAEDRQSNSGTDAIERKIQAQELQARVDEIQQKSEQQQDRLKEQMEIQKQKMIDYKDHLSDAKLQMQTQKEMMEQARQRAQDAIERMKSR